MDNQQLADAIASTVARKVTIEDIEREIESEYCFTAHDGYAGASLTREFSYFPEGKGEIEISRLAHEHGPVALKLLTICVLVLRNGFTVVGTAGVASPENYRKDIGEQVARNNAIAQVWPLLGFRLRDELAKRQRMLDGRLVSRTDGEMKVYIGTKVVHARPIDRGSYVDLRGWELPGDEDPTTEGYLVEYTDKVQNMFGSYQGYVTWSPKDVFDAAYTPV